MKDYENKFYSFLDYLVDICDLNRKFLLANPRHTLTLWDVHGEPYLEFCEAHEYDFEDLGELE